MKAFVVQLKVTKAIDNFFAATVSDEKKQKGQDGWNSDEHHYYAPSLLCAQKGRWYDHQSKMWEKLEQLYLVKSLPEWFLLLELNFGFKMDSTKNLDYMFLISLYWILPNV